MWLPFARVLRLFQYFGSSLIAICKGFKWLPWLRLLCARVSSSCIVVWWYRQGFSAISLVSVAMCKGFKWFERKHVPSMSFDGIGKSFPWCRSYCLLCARVLFLKIACGCYPQGFSDYSNPLDHLWLLSARVLFYKIACGCYPQGFSSHSTPLAHLWMLSARVSKDCHGFGCYLQGF